MSPTEAGKLSKDEVEALLAASRDEPSLVEQVEPARRVQGYDFSQPSRFSRSQLDELKRLNEGVAAGAAAHASRLLRTNVKAQLVSTEQIKWEHLLEDIGDSTVGFVLSMEPLGYQAIIAIDREFAAGCLDRMMGGEGDAQAVATVEFTEIDVAVLAGFLRGFLDPLPELWGRIGEFTIEVGAFSQDLQGLDLFGAGEDLLQPSFLVQTRAASGRVVLVVPFAAVKNLPPESEPETPAPTMTEQDTASRLRESLERASIELTAVLGQADIKISRLVRAEPGDVIILDTRLGESIDIKLNGKTKFRGLPGKAGTKLAVELIVEE
jgi:flagellar motor switch protein FliM